MESMAIVDKLIHQSHQAIETILASDPYKRDVIKLSSNIIDCINKGGTIYVAGNGGSAADAQHLAAELVSRFLAERKPLPCISLTTDTSVMTAIANDYGYESIISRQLNGLAKPGDFFIGLTTSGKSKNIIKGLEECAKLKVRTCVLTGSNSLSTKATPDYLLKAPSTVTATIQEIHGLTIHLICALVESFFLKTNND